MLKRIYKNNEDLMSLVDLSLIERLIDVKSSFSLREVKEDDNEEHIVEITIGDRILKSESRQYPLGWFNPFDDRIPDIEHDMTSHVFDYNRILSVQDRYGNRKITMSYSDSYHDTQYLIIKTVPRDIYQEKYPMIEEILSGNTNDDHQWTPFIGWDESTFLFRFNDGDNVVCYNYGCSSFDGFIIHPYNIEG